MVSAATANVNNARGFAVLIKSSIACPYSYNEWFEAESSSKLRGLGLLTYFVAVICPCNFILKKK